jgi:hypothetical protein
MTRLHHPQQAWIVREYLAGRSQKDIGRELGCVSSAVICSAVKRFCDNWSGIDVQRHGLYNEERRKVALVALREYFFNGDGLIERPVVSAAQWGWGWGPRDLDKVWTNARLEHVWLLRAEGLTSDAIGERIGVSRGRAWQMARLFGRRMSYAMRRVRISNDLQLRMKRAERKELSS